MELLLTSLDCTCSLVMGHFFQHFILNGVIKRALSANTFLSWLQRWQAYHSFETPCIVLNSSLLNMWLRLKHENFHLRHGSLEYDIFCSDQSLLNSLTILISEQPLFFFKLWLSRVFIAILSDATHIGFKFWHKTNKFWEGC